MADDRKQQNVGESRTQNFQGGYRAPDSNWQTLRSAPRVANHSLDTGGAIPTTPTATFTPTNPNLYRVARTV